MKSAIRTSILATVAIALSASATQVASAAVVGGASQFAGSTASANHVGGCNPYPYPPPSPKLTFGLGSIITLMGLYLGL